MKLALLNTTIATTDGMYKITTIDLETARDIFHRSINDLDSAIGHESTAQLMNILLETDKVQVNRQQFSQQVNQTSLVFKLKGRAPEGVILGVEEIEEIGYEFKLMTRLS